MHSSNDPSFLKKVKRKDGENTPVEEVLRPAFIVGELGARLFGTPNTAEESEE